MRSRTWSDRLDVAARDRLGGPGQRALEAEELKQRMVRQVVGFLPLD